MRKSDSEYLCDNKLYISCFVFFACVILLNKMPKTAVVPLTFRQLSKEDSHFLVKYHEDGELQVRSRGFVLTQAKVLFEPRYEKTSFFA